MLRLNLGVLELIQKGLKSPLLTTHHSSQHYVSRINQTLGHPHYLRKHSCYILECKVIFVLPDTMMNCQCRHQNHLSCLGKPHLITVRGAQDGQRLLHKQGTYLSFFHTVFHSHKHKLICVNLAVWQT